MADSPESITQSVPVQDRIGDIGRFGARGPAVVRHGLEHLGRRDDRLRAHVRQAHQPLLHDGDLLDWNLHPEISRAIMIPSVTSRISSIRSKTLDRLDLWR